MTTTMTNHMRTAFDLVNPAHLVRELIDRGILPKTVDADWRAPIAVMVTDEQLSAAGVSIDDVIDAVAFFTACKAQVSRERIAGLPWVSFLEAKPGWLVIADGYRNGPAGP